MAKQQPSGREQLIGLAEAVHVLPEFTGVVASAGGGQRLVAMQAAVVKFMDISRPNERPEFVHGPLFAAVMSMNERRGRWLRAVEHRAHVIDGVVVIGGMGGSDDRRSKGGLYAAIAVEKPAASAAGVALQRAALGQTFWREDLPDGLRAAPEGAFRDMRAPAERSISLWHNHYRHRAANRRLQKALKVAYIQVQDRIERELLQRQTHLLPPKIWSTAADGAPIALRWRDATEAEVAAHALDHIDAVVASRLERGDWAVEGLEMTAGIEGWVKAVDGLAVTIVDDDGSEVVVELSCSELRRHVQRITGFDASDMPVVPLVEEGRVVGPDTCLFGPGKPQAAVTTAKLRAAVEQTDAKARERRIRGLHLCRLWAVMAEGRAHRGQTLYPNELVSAKGIDQIYFQIAGEGSTHAAWDRSVQQVALERAETCLRAAGVGFDIDLYNTSHRAENEQRVEAARNLRGGNDNVAPAGKQRAKKSKQAKRPVVEA